LALVNIQVQNGDEIRAPWELFVQGKSIGVVTSVANPSSLPEGSIRDSRTGLAMLRRGFFLEGSAWFLDGGEILKIGNNA